jgi:hypothetical protein
MLRVRIKLLSQHKLQTMRPTHANYLPTYLPTYLPISIEQSPFWEANRSSANPETPPHFMEPEGSLPRLQEPATCPYPKPEQSYSCLLFPLLEDTFEYYPPMYAYDLQVDSFYLVSLPNHVCTPPVLHTCHTPSQSHSSWLFGRIIFGEEYRSLRYSLGSVLHSPVTLSLLGPSYLLQHPNLQQSQSMVLPRPPQHGASSGCGWRNGFPYGG